MKKSFNLYSNIYKILGLTLMVLPLLVGCDFDTEMICHNEEELCVYEISQMYLFNGLEDDSPINRFEDNRLNNRICVKDHIACKELACVPGGSITKYEYDGQLYGC